MSFLTSFRQKKSKSTRGRTPAKWHLLRKWGLRAFLLGGIIWIVLIAAAANLHGNTAIFISENFHRIAVNSGFKLQQIEVHGRHYTSSNALQKTINLDQGSSIFKVDITDAHQRIVDLPWVKNAEIRRSLPQTIIISITEHTPMALWQHNGKITLLNEHGDTIPTAILHDFSNLPIVTGNDAPQHTAALLDILKAEPVIWDQFDSAVRVGNRRWDIKLKNGLNIKLPEQDLTYAIARIAEAEREYLIFSKEILSLDARFSDRMIVKASSGAADRLTDYISSASSSDTNSVSP